MSYTTLNVVDIEIKIGSGEFEETAGYGPNESDVIATIRCSGAGSSTVQLRGCTEDHECADSPARAVTITG
jgi:ABC-type histidine transport system ATPase subunit